MKNFFKKEKNTRTNSGFSMVEVLIAASIIAVSILAAMWVAQKSVALSRQSLHSVQASNLLEEGAEAMRSLRDEVWGNIGDLDLDTEYYLVFSGGEWTLSGTPGTIGIFTRHIVVSAVNRDNSSQDISENGSNDDSTRLVTVTVSWQEGAETLSKTLSFYVMDIFS